MKDILHARTLYHSLLLFFSSISQSNVALEYFENFSHPIRNNKQTYVLKLSILNMYSSVRKLFIVRTEVTYSKLSICSSDFQCDQSKFINRRNPGCIKCSYRPEYSWYNIVRGNEKFLWSLNWKIYFSLSIKNLFHGCWFCK